MLSRRALIRGVAGLAWLAVTLIVPAADAQPPRPMQAPVPWVDVHLHLIGGRERSADYAGAVEAAIREMDRFGIAVAIVLPPPQVDGRSTGSRSTTPPPSRARSPVIAAGSPISAAAARSIR